MTAALTVVRDTRRPEEHNLAATRAAWSQRWGITVGLWWPWSTRWLAQRPCSGESCCWRSGGGKRIALDHVCAIIRQRDRRRGLLSQPFGLTHSSAAELTRWCVARGLGWQVTGEGWHYWDSLAIVIFPTKRSL